MATNINQQTTNYLNPPSNGHNSVAASRRSSIDPSDLSQADLSQEILPQDLFLQRLCLERKRAERSRKNFALILVRVEDFGLKKGQGEFAYGLEDIVNSARRKTDLAGWYQQGSIVGIIFNDLVADGTANIYEGLCRKFQEAIGAHRDEKSFHILNSSVHVFANHLDDNGSNNLPDPVFYPDLFRKRTMDVVGSGTALILLAPLLVMIAVIIKLTSKGPAFFKQERLGLFGKTFTCLKFRSMYADT
jgi:hypothetical protein